MNETPLELRGTEARLRLLRPERNSELVRTVALFSAISDESPPLSIPPSSFSHFTGFVRRAQFRAGMCGMLVGLMLGIILGGFGVFFSLSGAGFRSLELRALSRVSPMRILVPEATDDAGTVCRVVRYYQGIPELCRHVE